MSDVAFVLGQDALDVPPFKLSKGLPELGSRLTLEKSRERSECVRRIVGLFRSFMATAIPAPSRLGFERVRDHIARRQASQFGDPGREAEHDLTQLDFELVHARIMDDGIDNARSVRPGEMPCLMSVDVSATGDRRRNKCRPGCTKKSHLPCSHAFDGLGELFFFRGLPGLRVCALRGFWINSPIAISRPFASATSERKVRFS